MTRPPAYAARLIGQRSAGRHPPAVVVSYGADWSPIERWSALPMVCVSPAHYKVGQVDWRCVVGLPVLLADRCVRDVDDTLDADGWRGIWWCAGELARVALGGYVSIWSRHVPRWVTEAQQLAAAYAKDDDRWPAWWTRPGAAEVRRAA